MTKILTYILYAFAAGIVFLYLLFPSDLIKEILAERLKQIQPEIEVKTEKIRPTIPPGLRFQPLSVYFADTPLLSSKKVKLKPHLLSMLSNSKIFSFNGPLGSGRFTGRAEIAHQQKRAQDLVNISLNAVPLASIDLFKKWPNFIPSGEIGGEIGYDSIKGGTGTVETDLVVAPARILLNPPLMGLEVLEFTELRAKLSVTHRKLTIRRCEAFGSQIEGKITGHINLRQPIGDSRPNLTLTVKPQAAFISEHKNDMIGGLLSSDKAQKRGMVFHISGTLDNPSYVIR